MSGSDEAKRIIHEICLNAEASVEGFMYASRVWHPFKAEHVEMIEKTQFFLTGRESVRGMVFRILQYHIDAYFDFHNDKDKKTNDS